MMNFGRLHVFPLRWMPVACNHTPKRPVRYTPIHIYAGVHLARVRFTNKILSDKESQGCRIDCRFRSKRCLYSALSAPRGDGRGSVLKACLARISIWGVCVVHLTIDNPRMKGVRLLASLLAINYGHASETVFSVSDDVLAFPQVPLQAESHVFSIDHF